MKALYDKISIDCSANITKNYSTSFSLGIKALGKELQNPIYAIYGFVRLADEIVDTFHEYPKEELLNQIEIDTYRAIEERISINPVLNSFQHAVHQFNIPNDLIKGFLKSMSMDLQKSQYNNEQFKEYVVGSAEVVGLMCLKVFCNGNEELYNRLKPNARSLGSAFQKINFLRDLKMDYEYLGRSYFPDIKVDKLNNCIKKQIEQDIIKDFKHGLEGIKQLPNSSRFGVYLAYVYFYTLLKKIENVNAAQILKARIRLNNSRKSWLLVRSLFKYHLNTL